MPLLLGRCGMQLQDPPLVAFLDEDNILELAQLLLADVGVDERRRIRRFIGPERIAVPEVVEIGSSLRGTVAVATPDRYHEAVARSTVVVFRRGSVTRDAIAGSPGLRLIQRLGASTSGVDLVAANEHGVQVSCLPRRSLVYAAEHTMLLVLALAKRVIAADQAVRSQSGFVAEAGAGSYNWVGLEGVTGLQDATLGLVGLGEIGRLVADRARAFGMQVLYTARSQRPAEEEQSLGVSFRPLADLLQEAQFVSVHAPANPATRDLIGRSEIERMSAGSFLVNTSQGSLVDEDALYDALSVGRLAGAALDVHRTEPRAPDDRFCELENVILTPHVASGSRQHVLEEIAAIFENIAAALVGVKPPNGHVCQN
jgi:phosphoglycerate dehydrogenase-like enzyme